VLDISLLHEMTLAEDDGAWRQRQQVLRKYWGPGIQRLLVAADRFRAERRDLQRWLTASGRGSAEVSARRREFDRAHHALNQAIIEWSAGRERTEACKRWLNELALSAIKLMKLCAEPAARPAAAPSARPLRPQAARPEAARPEPVRPAEERAPRGTLEMLGVLGLPASYDAALLRAQYRKLALRHHPDHGGSTVAMASINACYDYLNQRLVRAAG